ncbi:response regulator [Mesobacterium pallidum]|uniref:response regulator n=1 Tax=Mesobacterium pallidum TaxID=2872037 RepID=UPI001EE2B95A|nr:response regulator [Mesobacterium pallidum]
MSLAERLAQERRARLAAERLLELKQAELFAANRKLGRHAKALTEEIVETRAEITNVRTQNLKYRSAITAAHERIELIERRMWQTIQTIQDGFAFFDGDNQLIIANGAYLEAFDGLEEVKPGVSYPRLLQLVTEEGVVNTGDLGPAEWRAMMIERWNSATPDPITIRLWNNRYVRLIDQRGQGGDVVSVASDITREMRHQTQIKNARQRAEAANRAKSAFLANMSHEIRTPMNGVVGMSELLGDTPLTEEQRLYVSTIRSSAEALLVIINDVLDYSKIEADKLVLHPEPFDLERCIHAVTMMLQPTARDKGLSVLIDYDIFLPTLLVGDPGRVRQILTNLLGNAIKFTQKGHVLTRVTGYVEGETAQIIVTVEDTGIGIAPEMLDHVFGQFNQVEDERNRKFEGTGLGLAITKRLVELMGGEIWVESRLCEGSAFGFRLSLPMAEPVRAPDKRIARVLRRVMVVDSLAANRQIIGRQLGQFGLEVVEASSAAQAMAQIDARIDLVLTEHSMPDTDGLELAEQIRGKGLSVPILLLSANPGFAENDPARVLLAGVLQTPVLRSELQAAIGTIAELPLAPSVPALPEVGSMPDFSSVRGRPTAKGTGRRMRILAAEDNKTNRLVFGKMVKDAEITLEFAENGVEAVEAFGVNRPDLVFMDISMPVMDGKEATQEIRRLEAETGGHVPIVAMTAHAMTGDREAILAAGLDDYLTKPLKKKEILDMIRRHAPEDAMPPLPVADRAAV